MIISHKYKYLYVELPQTACTTVRKELIANYDGQEILFKHALYSDFLKIASPEQKDYFVFSNIRNPMDIVVSKFFKYKTDHVGAYSNQRKKKFGKFHKYFLLYTDRKRFKFIQNKEAGFSDFFNKFYHLPYSSWAILDHHRFDFLIRYEHLQEDFSRALELLQIEKVRDLPSKNVTAKKDKTFWEYYDTPQLKAKSKKLFSEYFKEWGYEFPPEWDAYPEANLSQLRYNGVNLLRKIYWRYLR